MDTPRRFSVRNHPGRPYARGSPMSISQLMKCDIDGAVVHRFVPAERFCGAMPSRLLEVSEFCFVDVVGNMLSQKPRLEQRGEEDDESADRHDQKPTRPYALSQSGGDII